MADIVERERATCDTLAKAYSLLTQLNDVTRYTFTPDKADLVNNLIDNIFEALRGGDGIGEASAVPKSEAALPGKERAQRAYIRGKALDAKEGYDPEAEVWLSRAVKLDPTAVEKWNALGHSFWKKGDLEAARGCFAKGCGGDDPSSLPQNAVSLREMSKLLRQVPKLATSESSELEAKRPDNNNTSSGVWNDSILATEEGRLRESLTKARQAVSLDVQDAESWFVLGNAYVSMFFKVEADPALMDKALAAYGRSERNGGERNPDLFFGRAQVHRYKEEYQRAADDYRSAARIDPSLPAAAALRDMDRFLARIAELLKNRGGLRPKRLRAVCDTLKEVRLPDGAPCSLVDGGASILISGPGNPNKGLALALRMIIPLDRGDFPPSSYLAVDSKGTFVILSVYHMDVSTLSDRDSLLVLDPRILDVQYTQDVAVSTKGASSKEMLAANLKCPVGRVSYRCIQVSNPAAFLVNGKSLKPAKSERLEVSATCE